MYTNVRLALEFSIRHVLIYLLTYVCSERALAGPSFWQGIVFYYLNFSALTMYLIAWLLSRAENVSVNGVKLCAEFSVEKLLTLSDAT